MRCDRLESWGEYFDHEKIVPGLLFLFMVFKLKHCEKFKTIKCRAHKLIDKCNTIMHAFFTARFQFKIHLQCENQALDE